MKVLFIGNSFTARNNLPALVAQIAKAAGERFDHHLISVGGASLRTHWNKGVAGKEIDRGQYDFVVLQEQSTLPIKNPQRMRENVLLFHDRIKRSGAKTALYMTWARLHAPQTQIAITQAYTAISREIGALLIPAGVAFKKLLSVADHPDLHHRDESHPTLAGSYLAACVMFTVLFKKKTTALAVPVNGLTTTEINTLQRTATAVARACKH